MVDGIKRVNRIDLFLDDMSVEIFGVGRIVDLVVVLFEFVWEIIEEVLIVVVELSEFLVELFVGIVV